MMLAFFSGAIGLALQMVWLRAVDLATGSHPIVFGVVIGLQLLGLAFGALWAGAELRAGRDSEAHLAWGLLAGGVLAYTIVPVVAWASVHAIGWAAAALLLFATSLCFGGMLPLLTALAHRTRTPAASVSRTYLANVCGAALAPLCTTYLAFDHIGLDHTSLLVCAMSVALGAIAGGRALPSVAAAAALALLVVTVPPSIGGLVLGRRGGGHLAEVLENRSSVIGVTADDRVYGGGAYDGAINVSLAEGINGITRAYLALLLAPQAQQVLEIGVSTGARAQVIANAPAVERMTLVEINPGYETIIARHHEVQSLIHNPKVDWVTADGRIWLARHPAARFDLIVMNTTFHWRSQATNLLSREFMRLLKAHLAPGGMIYLNTTGSQAVLHTVASEFPFVATCANFVAAKMQPFAIDRDAFMTMVDNWSIDGAPVSSTAAARTKLQTALAAPLTVDRDTLLARVSASPIITDDNMAEEFRWLRGQ